MKFKKPKFWDLNKPNFLSYLLIIFTIPIIINNIILNFKSKKKSKEIKTICVGNIYLGGTGKTPTTIELSNILKKLKFKVATAKKFYKSQIDEQILLKKKTDFILSPNRKEIVKKAIVEKYNFLIFDDGLQDREIDYDLKFVCFDGNNLIGNGQLIPSGPLREKIKSLKKYDAVFLKNSQNLSSIEILKTNNSEIEIFNTYYQIKNLNEFINEKNYLIFSGIGNPENFKKLLIDNKLNVVKELIFPDHFNYKTSDINNIKKMAQDMNAKIITTEKDYVKILEKDRFNISFLEIEIKIENEKKLINFIESKINV